MTCEIFDSFYPPSFFAPLELTAGPNILPSKIHILIFIFGTFDPNHGRHILSPKDPIFSTNGC